MAPTVPTGFETQVHHQMYFTYGSGPCGTFLYYLNRGLLMLGLPIGYDLQSTLSRLIWVFL